MNILYLLGNGFDLNLGLKTTYQDFYKYYTNLKSPNNSVIKLKESIEDDKKNWSDLEIALGQYTEKIGSSEEFDKIYEDLAKQLSNYLTNEELKFDFNAILLERIFEDFAFPKNHLLLADKNMLKEYKKRLKQEVNIDVITFNYTHSLEKILKSKMEKGTTKIRDIIHIHGELNKGMLIGVNDESQIANKKFHGNEDILDILVKPKANQVQKHNIDLQSKRKIQQADFLCIFGLSTGETDKLWWDYIGRQLISKAAFYLIIFNKGDTIPSLFSSKIGSKEREIKNLFLKRTTLNENEKNKVKNKIFIGYNTGMFNFNQKEILKNS